MMRSSRPDVRNPLLALPGIDRFAELEPAVVAPLVALIVEYEAVCRQRGQASWDRHKPPMAAYWMAWAVNFRHARVALRWAMKRTASGA